MLCSSSLFSTVEKRQFSEFSCTLENKRTTLGKSNALLEKLPVTVFRCFKMKACHSYPAQVHTFRIHSQWHFSDSSKWTPIIPYPAQLQALQTWNLHNKLKHDFLISFIVLIYGRKLWQKVTIVWKMWCVSISIKFMQFAPWINVGLRLHGFAAIW